MSFLNITPTQQTGLQIKSWLDSCKSSMQSAKDTFESIKNWLEVVKNNPEYTPEDLQEVVTKLEELRNFAISLTE